MSASVEDLAARLAVLEQQLAARQTEPVFVADPAPKRRLEDLVPGVLRDLLGSKKALAMLAGLVVACAGKFGVRLSHEESLGALGIIATYLLAQGAADLGKHRGA